MLDLKKVQQRITDIAADFRAYLELTQKDRTKITKTDKRRMETLDAELNAILDPVERSNLTVDVTTVARFFNVTARTIQLWTKSGCPKLRHGLYDLKEVHLWWVQYINSSKDSEETENVKAEYWYWQKENARLKAQQTSQDLIPYTSVIPSWAARIAEVKAYLMFQQPDRIPALLDLDEEAHYRLREILLTENRKALETYCRDGKFTPGGDTDVVG